MGIQLLYVRQPASLDDQMDVAERIVKQNGYKVVKRFREKASASKHGNRPQFDQMIHTNDRIYYPWDNVLIFGVEAGMAAQYSIDLSKNVIRGMHSKNKKGGWNHVAPQGYLNGQDEITRQPNIIPDPKRFPLIKKMFMMYLTGNYSVPELVSIMNDDWHYLTPKHKHVGGKPMSITGLYAILANPFYAGKLKDYDDPNHLIYGQWPAMITWEQYLYIQSKKDDFMEKHNRRPVSYKNGKIKHELKG